MDNSATSPLPVTPSIPTRDKNSTLTLILIGIVIILCLGFIVVIIGYLALTSGTNKAANNSLNTTSNTTTSNTTNSIVATQPAITITTPEANAVVNGKIMVVGSATYHFINIKIELLDDDSNSLGIANVTLNPVSDGPSTINRQIDVIESPKTAKGKIVITSTSPAFSVSQSVTFETYSQTAATLVIAAPLKDQVMYSNVINIRGSAKGLFEGTLNLRLKDQLGTVIYTDNITIPDQYTAFRDFDYQASIDNLSTAKGTTGTWEFYYNSAKDGSEVMLQSVQVRFL